MTAATLDTNVLASGIAGEAVPGSTPGELFRRWQRDLFELVLSEHVLAELNRTLPKSYFRARVSQERAARAMLALRRWARITPLTVVVTGVATHPADDLVLATAVSGHVDYLVTGDLKLQALRRFRGVTIVSPRAFLDLLERADSASS